MIYDIINDVNDLVINMYSYLPFKQRRILRRNNKRIKKTYYGNCNDFGLMNLCLISSINRILKKRGVL